MKIAITGSTGFLGKHFTEELKKQNIKFVEFDKEKNNLLDIDSLKSFVENVDIIFHLAGVTKESPETLLGTNTLGTITLLKATKKFNKRPVCKFIYASSIHVYPMRNVYAYSKKIAEEFIQLQSDEKIKGIVFRFSNIYGPGCEPFLNSVIATLAYQASNDKKLTINGDGNQKRDYIFVGDVVRALMNVIGYNPQENHEVFDICSGKLSSLNTVIKILESIKKTNIPVSYNEKIEQENWDLGINYIQTEKAFGWTPKVDLEEGLRLTMAQLVN